MRKITVLAACAALAAGGCSTRPLPEDVTRSNTFGIVQKIRCEARDAIQAKFISMLLLAEDAKTQEVGKELSASKEDFRVFTDKYSNGQVWLDDLSHERIGKYRETVIALRFEFEISENNKNSINTALRDPISNGIFGLTLKGGNDRLRKRNRSFTVADTFDEIFRSISKEECEGLVSMNPRTPGYPITGNVGLKEVVWTFLDLAEFARYYKAKDPAEFVDTLSFETRFYGNLDPKFTASTRITSGIYINEAGSGSEADRKDIHKVTVSLVLPAKPSPPPRYGPMGISRKKSAPANSQSIESAKEKAIQNMDNVEGVRLLRQIEEQTR